MKFTIIGKKDLEIQKPKINHVSFSHEKSEVEVK